MGFLGVALCVTWPKTVLYEAKIGISSQDLGFKSRALQMEALESLYAFHYTLLVENLGIDSDRPMFHS